MRLFGLAITIVCLALAGSPVRAENCTRLPLSDVAFGKKAATESARVKLLEYAYRIAKKRGWPEGRPFAKSRETVSCKVYLDFGPFGTEYRCLVTATFCQH